MDRERWSVVESLFHAAATRPAGERAAFLSHACGDDHALRHEIESLLAESTSTSDVFERPALAVAAGLVSTPDAYSLIGARIGVYDILAPIGTGGMGEVYRARDTRLGRDVAIKVVPPEFTKDPERLARFDREAHALAALNHPNIATIYGFEESGTVKALAMELVEGETLADVLTRCSPAAASATSGGTSGAGRRRALPIDRALAIARQLADALDAAHEKGIVHRDLKPANIKVTPDGIVKVLDFGLAKICAPDPDAGMPANAALTGSSRATGATEEGRILGTTAYMSPEQARGQAVDKRADIWAFGCVLYEMLTGRMAFAGDTVSETIARILEREPDWAALPSGVAPGVVRLLRRCLEKDTRRRLRDIGDARMEFEAAGVEPAGTSTVSPSRQRPSWAIPIAVLCAAIVGGALVMGLRFFSTASSPDWGQNVVTLAVDPPEGTEIAFFHFAVSPTGGHLTWVGTGGGDNTRRLWLRTFDSPVARELPGTEGASYPFWSPDGRSVGFITQASIKRVDVASGVVQTLANTAAAAQGAAWGTADVVIFSARLGLYQVPASGGDVSLVATLDPSRQENSLRFPQFLPDGRRFLYVARSGRHENSSAYIGSLDDRRPRRMFSVLSKVEYASGHVFYAEGSRLMARPFDLGTLDLGPPVAIAEDVGGGNLSGLVGYFSVSDDVLAYRAYTPLTSVLRWFDRSGQALDTAGPPRDYGSFQLSPDGRRVMTVWPDERTGSRSVWLLEAGHDTPSRLTFAGVDEFAPVWSPDGNHVAFGSYRNGPFDLFIKPVSGGGADTPFLVDEEQANAESWSSDGFLAYYYNRQTTRRDLFAAKVIKGIGHGDPIRIADSPADEHASRFSSDGRWIAYVSDETGQREVYVQPFPPTGARWQISVEGGTDPSWRADGRELFYLRSDGTLTAVDVRADATGLRVGSSARLFNAGEPDVNAVTRRYDAMPDGQRFLVNVPSDPPPAKPVRVLINWRERLNRIPTR